MTNGDKIRAMTDKELAAWVAGEILRLDGVSFAVSAEYWCMHFGLKEGEKWLGTKKN